MSKENVQWAASIGMEAWKRDSNLPRKESHHDAKRVTTDSAMETVLEPQSGTGIVRMEQPVWGGKSKNQLQTNIRRSEHSRSDTEVAGALLHGNHTDSRGNIIPEQRVNFIRNAGVLPVTNIIVDLGKK